jgi:flagellin
MSLGVLNNISALYAQNSLNQTQSSLNTVLQQLSSGQRINSGADDPAGLAVSDGLAANQAALTQSSANATDGVGFLQTADGALAQVTNLLDSAVSIATEAANGTLTTSQVSSANQEYQNILNEIGDIGSTTNFNSISVFSSTATDFFVSDGSSTGVNNYEDTIGSLTTASVGTSATSAAATTTAITTPTPTAATTAAGATATFALAASSDEISGTIAVTVGSGSAVSVNLGTAGVSLADAATTLNASTSFSGAGLVAAVGTGANANQLIITGPAETVTAGTGTALTNATPVNTYTSTAITNPTASASTNVAGSEADITLGATTDTLSGTLSVAVGIGTANTFTLASGTTVADAVSQLNADNTFSGANLVASQGTGANAGELIITGPVGASGASTLDLSGSTLTDASTTAVASSSATFSLGNTTDTVSGTLSLGVNGNTANNFTLAAGTTVAAAVTQLNADNTFSGSGLVATQGTGANAGQLIITNSSGSLNVSASSLTDTTAAGDSNEALSLSGTAVNDIVPA